MHLYLIRHGEKNVEYDGSLSERGQQQATRLAQWFPREVPHVDAIYSSTMRRAAETAHCLAERYHKTVLPDDRVREYGCNYADHRPIPADLLNPQHSLAEKSPHALPLLPIHEVPGCESWCDFGERVTQFLQEILLHHFDPTLKRETARRIVVVCHGGVINAVFDHVFNIDRLHRPCEMWQENTAITYFERRNDPWYEPWRLHYHARAEHLR